MNKLKAWIKDAERMVEVESLDFNAEKIMYMHEKTLYVTSFDNIILRTPLEMNDINGVPIYTGDIVIASYEEKYKNILGTVHLGKFSPRGSNEKLIGFYGSFMFTTTKSDKIKIIERQESILAFDSLEVVGNIYENGDLVC